MADADLNFLQKKAQDWAKLVVELYNTPVPPALQPEKTALINSAKSIKTMVEKITGPLPYLSEMNQLGFLPVIIAGAAAIAWAIAAIVKWTTDYSAFKTQISEYQKMVNSGVAPEKASDIMLKKDKVLDWKQIAKYGIPAALIGGLIIFLVKKKG